jgi:hypothetical protein
MKNTLSAVLVIALISMACMASPASAGQPHQRNGFFLGFGMGAGSAGWEGTTDRTGGFVGNFRIGYAPAPEVTVGLESSSWLKQETVGTIDLNLLYTVTTFGVTYFPGQNGLFLKGGIGFASANFETVVTLPGLGTGKGELNDTGLGLLGATGYEWRLTEKFAIGPEIELAYLNVGGAFKTANYVSASLMLNWYW